ncbi:MAG: hypothetical protein IPK78_08970 [Rhodospirillales bacterium]|nr:hypothetical protein [Rhodospirillales bacterium]
MATKAQPISLAVEANFEVGSGSPFSLSGLIGVAIRFMLRASVVRTSIYQSGADLASRPRATHQVDGGEEIRKLRRTPIRHRLHSPGAASARLRWLAPRQP